METFEEMISMGRMTNQRCRGCDLSEGQEQCPPELRAGGRGKGCLGRVHTRWGASSCMFKGEKQLLRQKVILGKDKSMSRCTEV